MNYFEDETRVEIISAIYVSTLRLQDISGATLMK